MKVVILHDKNFRKIVTERSLTLICECDEWHTYKIVVENQLVYLTIAGSNSEEYLMVLPLTTSINEKIWKVRNSLEFKKLFSELLSKKVMTF